MLYFDGTKENVYSAMGTICVNTGIGCLSGILDDNNNTSNRNSTAVSRINNETAFDFGWEYHCDGYRKHGKKFVSFARKYRKSNTIGVVLNTDNGILSFSVNGRPCQKPFNDLPKQKQYILDVSGGGMNCISEVTIIGLSK